MNPPEGGRSKPYGTYTVLIAAICNAFPAVHLPRASRCYALALQGRMLPHMERAAWVGTPVDDLGIVWASIVEARRAVAAARPAPLAPPATPPPRRRRVGEVENLLTIALDDAARALAHAEVMDETAALEAEARERAEADAEAAEARASAALTPVRAARMLAQSPRAAYDALREFFGM